MNHLMHAKKTDPTLAMEQVTKRDNNDCILIIISKVRGPVKPAVLNCCLIVLLLVADVEQTSSYLAWTTLQLSHLTAKSVPDFLVQLL